MQELFIVWNVDGVTILVGPLNALEKIHSKLQEHNIVVVNCQESGNASFVTSLTENATIFTVKNQQKLRNHLGKKM